MTDNIFEAAAEQSRNNSKKKEDKLSDKKTGEKKLSTSNSQHYSTDELQKMLARMQQMREDLEKQVATLYEQGKEKNIDVDCLMGGTYKLTTEEIQAIAQQEKILKEKINKVLPPESCLQKKAKGKEKLTQERKGKFRGARQKWLPM